MPSSTIIALGSINTDLVIKGPRLPTSGETVLGGTFYRAAGGKGANQAVAAARSSRHPVTLIAAIGDDDFGRASLDGLSRENICWDYVKIVPDQASGVALIMVNDLGQNCISVASGANMCLAPEDVDAVPDDVFAGAKVFMACLESPLETVLRGMQRAKEANLLTILNPAPASKKLVESGILRYVDVVTPNEKEATVLIGQTVYDVPTATTAGRVLRDLGCPSAIITLGSRGSVVVDDAITLVDAYRVSAVDSTGAGDAFNGALAVALAEGRPLVEAAQWANVAACLSVTRHGAQPSLPARAEIETMAVEMAAKQTTR
jgi:ribokinase